MAITKEYRRSRIKLRIRKVVKGTTARPRLAVFRSNKAIYAQLIDDSKGVTLASASSSELDTKGNKVELAAEVGKAIAAKAAAAGITAAVFDRGGYLYHGRVKSLAEGARTGGLTL